MAERATEDPNAVTFVPFPKLHRLKRSCCITEKLDGTNACVVVTADGTVAAQSRNRLTTPDSDNYGFAAWVERNRAELLKLGRGHHYGEWWGIGINRGYAVDHRKFSLFNVDRPPESVPACCSLVPILYRGDFTTDAVDDAMRALAISGSLAAPGYMLPEGVVVYLPAARAGFKVTYDDKHKELNGPAGI